MGLKGGAWGKTVVSTGSMREKTLLFISPDSVEGYISDNMYMYVCVS